MKRFFLTLCALCATTALWAATATVNGITWTYSVSNGKVTIGPGSWGSPAISSSTSGSITIPSTLGGYPVTSIGQYAFYNCRALTSVTIPEGVTLIGDYAFYNCTGLTSVTISEGVTSIGSYAFSWCTGLTSITIPSSVTSIGEWAFYRCSGLTSVTIPSSVTSIGDRAFYYCSSLTSVTIPSSVTSIGGWAFSGCSGLTSVTIPDSVTSIGYATFSGCSKLKIVVDENNPNYTSQEGVLFNKAMTTLICGPGATASYTIPEGVTSIGDWAFDGCRGLTSVAIPSSVTSIGSSAFYNCSGLTSVTIPSSVTSIGRDAFSGCSGLTSIMIPSSVTSIRNYAFSGCSGLTSVTIPSSVTSIGSSAFYNCSGLTSITIPEGVTSIGSYAFSDCSGLTSVTIPSSVTSIGDWAFSGCSQLKIVVDENNSNYTSQEGVLFNKAMTTLIRGPGATASYVIPSSVTSIGDRAFSGCSGLTSVTIPSSVTSIGDSAFYDCSGLTSITIPSSVTSIGRYAFYNCSGLTSVTIPSTVTSIGYATFSGCSQLKIVVDENNPNYTSQEGVLFNKAMTTLICGPGATASYTIPSSVTAIEDYAFYYCSSLTSVTIPEGVTSIGEKAFYYCSSLTSITIPEGVTSIREEAFYNCSGLTSVEFLGVSPSVGARPFYNVTATGTYLSKYASEWEAVISNGKWNGLTMVEVEATSEITFDANGGEGGEVVTLVCGSTLTAPTVSREGYTFVGWSPEMPAIVPNEDTTYTAQWQEILISFKVALTAVGGGTVTGADQYAEGASVTVSATADEGYVFCGWGATPAVMTPEYTFTMPAEDVTLTAYFAPEQVVDQAVQQHITENNLMSKDDAKQELLDADEVYTADEMKEMAFEAPVVEVGADEIEISISLQTADSLDAWEAMALQGATLEVDQAAGKVRVRVPKGDKKAAFYKFVVPTDQSK